MILIIFIIQLEKAHISLELLHPYLTYSMADNNCTEELCVTLYMIALQEIWFLCEHPTFARRGRYEG
jgi:hypothetical protein